MIQKIFVFFLLFSIGYNASAQQITPFDIGAITLPSYNLADSGKVFSIPYITNCENTDCSEAIETAWAYALRAALESRYLVKYNKKVTDPNMPRFSITELLTKVEFSNIDKILPATKGKNIFGKNNPIHAINYFTKGGNGTCVNYGELDENLYPLGITEEGADICSNREPIAFITNLHMLGRTYSSTSSNYLAQIIKEKGAILANIPWNSAFFDKATKKYRIPSFNYNFYLPVVIVGWGETSKKTELTARSSFIDGDFYFNIETLGKELHLYTLDIDTIKPNAILHYDDKGPDFVTAATHVGLVKEGIEINVNSKGVMEDDYIDYSVVVKYTTPNSSPFRVSKLSLFSSNTRNIKVEIFNSEDVDPSLNKIQNSLAIGELDVESMYYGSKISVGNTGYYTIPLDKEVRVKGDFYVRATITTKVLDLVGNGLNYVIVVPSGVGFDPVVDLNKSWYSDDLTQAFAKDFASATTNNPGKGAKPTLRVNFNEPWHVNLDIENTIKYIGESDPVLSYKVLYPFGDCGKFDCAKNLDNTDTLRFVREVGEILGNYKYKLLKVTSNGSDLDTSNIYRFHNTLELKNRHLKIIQLPTYLHDSCSFAPYLSVDVPDQATIKWERLNVSSNWEIILGEIHNTLLVKESGTYRAIVRRKNQNKETNSTAIKIAVTQSIVSNKSFYTVSIIP